jgi:hypothetical protein
VGVGRLSAVASRPDCVVVRFDPETLMNVWKMPMVEIANVAITRLYSAVAVPASLRSISTRDVGKFIIDLCY